MIRVALPLSMLLRLIFVRRAAQLLLLFRRKLNWHNMHFT